MDEHDLPDWLVMLREAYTAAEEPTFRAVAEPAGISVMAAYSVLKGRNVPKLGTIKAMVNHLCADDPERGKKIIDAYLEDQKPRFDRDLPRSARRSQLDTETLIAALTENTEALRQMTAALRESR